MRTLISTVYSVLSPENRLLAARFQLVYLVIIALDTHQLATSGKQRQLVDQAIMLKLWRHKKKKALRLYCSTNYVERPAVSNVRFSINQYSDADVVAEFRFDKKGIQSLQQLLLIQT